MTNFPTSAGHKYQGYSQSKPFLGPTKSVGIHPETVSLEMQPSGEDEPVQVKCLNFIGGQLVTIDTETTSDNQQILLANSSQVIASVRATNATILGEAVIRLQPGESIGITFDGTNFVVNE